MHLDLLDRKLTIAFPGGRLHVTGAPSRVARDAISTAQTYLKTSASRLGLSRSPADYDLHTQLVNLMNARTGGGQVQRTLRQSPPPARETGRRLGCQSERDTRHRLVTLSS